jgi:hypothetical protein
MLGPSLERDVDTNKLLQNAFVAFRSLAKFGTSSSRLAKES